MIVRYDALAARIRDRDPRAGPTRVIAVDGPAGSGKTTFAARLAMAIGAPIIHADDLCPGWTGLDRIGPLLIEHVLGPLAAGSAPRYQRYDWDRAAYAEWHEVPSAPTLLIEGVNTGSRAAARYLSLLLWIDAPFELRLARGLERDGEGARELWGAGWRKRPRSSDLRERGDARICASMELRSRPATRSASS